MKAKTFLEDEWMETYKKPDNTTHKTFHKCLICKKYESWIITHVRKHIISCAAKTKQKHASSEQNNETNGTSEKLT